MGWRFSIPSVCFLRQEWKHPTVVANLTSIIFPCENLDVTSMALEDWAKYLDQYSVADGREQLKDLSAAAEDILIALTKYSPDLGSADAARCAALINILVYLQRQLSRFIRSGEESCDLLAWIARNILETRLWVQYLLEDSANFERFLRETEIDARELFERIGEYRQNAGKTDDNFAALAESLRERHGNWVILPNALNSQSVHLIH
jgi:hypothetical protein